MILSIGALSDCDGTGGVWYSAHGSPESGKNPVLVNMINNWIYDRDLRNVQKISIVAH